MSADYQVWVWVTTAVTSSWSESFFFVSDERQIPWTSYPLAAEKEVWCWAIRHGHRRLLTEHTKHYRPCYRKTACEFRMRVRQTLSTNSSYRPRLTNGTKTWSLLSRWTRWQISNSTTHVFQKRSDSTEVNALELDSLRLRHNFVLKATPSWNSGANLSLSSTSSNLWHSSLLVSG